MEPTPEKFLELEGINNNLNLFGALDQNIKIIEDVLGVNIIARENKIRIVGEVKKLGLAEEVVKKLIDLSKKGENITKQKVDYFVKMILNNEADKLKNLDTELICTTYKGNPIKPKTYGQKNYIEQILKKPITIAIGPAGTGKTFLAVAAAVSSFKKREVSKIILTRPAVEAGETLGFLPGDLQEKINPYLRPLYDALHEIMGPDTYLKLVERGLIEVAPLAYMRGRTIDNAFIILDEAQNTTPEQMKMFLTRIGFNSKIIVAGDVTQVDLPKDKKSGLNDAYKVLKNINDIGFVQFDDRDVVRHEIVQKIINAYERYNNI